MAATAEYVRLRTFDIRTTWYLVGEPEELTEIVLDPGQLAHWCRTVFMDCEVLAPGDGRGLGMRTKVYTKGWLPHSFVFSTHVSRIVPHRYMKIDCEGDFEGFGELEVIPENTRMRVEIRWTSDCHHRFIGPLSRLLPWVFELNHRWAMRRGSALMQRELDRRRRHATPGPAPVPTFPHNIPALRSLFRKGRSGEARPST